MEIHFANLKDNVVFVNEQCCEKCCTVIFIQNAVVLLQFWHSYFIQLFWYCSFGRMTSRQNHLNLFRNFFHHVHVQYKLLVINDDQTDML